MELIPESTIGKMVRLDVRAHLQDGTMVDVEVQNTNQKNITKRMTYYLSELYTNGIRKGEDYRHLKKTIVIGILNFNYFEDLKEYHTKWNMREQNHSEKTLEEHEIHFIELPKFRAKKKLNRKLENKLEEWLAFIEKR